MEEVLDTYHDCFILEPSERVRADSPLNSYQGHRLAYIIIDKAMKNPTRVLVVPYLHERRIYLNRLKPGIEYFYTTIQTSYDAERNYYKAVKQALENGKKANTVDFDKILNKSTVGGIKGSESFTTIVGMNYTTYKLYMYTQAGILINRVAFKPLVDGYGEPTQTSNNGQMFVFKKSFE